MPMRGRRMGSAQEPSETIASDTARMIFERTALGQSVKAEATASPTESEIAAVAYQLWVSNGCPAGSDREDWYRAEAILKDSLAANCEDPSRRPPIPRCDSRAGFEMVAEFRYEGHWEVWEREWGGARWIWDDATPGVGVSNQTG